LDGKTLKETTSEVLRRLGDTANQVWTSREIENYLIDAYIRLSGDASCFWDVLYLENLPYTADHVCEWELDYITTLVTDLNSHNFNHSWEPANFPGYTSRQFNYVSEWEPIYSLEISDEGKFTAQYEYTYTIITNNIKSIYFGEFQYTSIWENSYIDDGIGPGNHTGPWEYQNKYLTKEYMIAVSQLPENLEKVERPVNNWKRMHPLVSFQIETGDPVYETQEGFVSHFLMDKDGLRSFRKWKVPATRADEYTVTGDFGIMRDFSDLTTEDLSGVYGIPRQVPGQMPIGPDRFGNPRRFYKDENNCKVEFYRHGEDVSWPEDEFELPSMYVKYLTHFACWKALTRDSAGTDIKLGEHYKARWDMGLKRLKHRLSAVKENRVGVLGGSPRVLTRPPRPRLPVQYGREVR
jgi:hypothetical protein